MPAQRHDAGHHLGRAGVRHAARRARCCTEQIFTIPGFGKLIVDAVYNRDYAVVQGVVLVTAVIYVFMSMLADIGYVLANPRLRE